MANANNKHLTFQLRQCLQFGGIFSSVMRWTLWPFLFFRFYRHFTSKWINTIQSWFWRHCFWITWERPPISAWILMFISLHSEHHGSSRMHICQIRGNTNYNIFLVFLDQSLFLYSPCNTKIIPIVNYTNINIHKCR